MTTRATTMDVWSGGVCPFDAGWRKVMMWWFIVTDGLLFAGFLASYGYARRLSDMWPDQQRVFSLPYIAAMTFVLITSSATMAVAVAIARERPRDVAKYILLTAIGGLMFLSMQAYEWAHVIDEGLRLGTNPWGDRAFGAYFFLMTGFHGTHVLIGVIVLLITASRAWRGVSSPDGIEVAGLYWHFVDLVWVFIFTLFYLL